MWVLDEPGCSQDEYWALGKSIPSMTYLRTYERDPGWVKGSQTQYIATNVSQNIAQNHVQSVVLKPTRELSKFSDNLIYMNSGRMIEV